MANTLRYLVVIAATLVLTDLAYAGSAEASSGPSSSAAASKKVAPVIFGVKIAPGKHESDLSSHSQRPNFDELRANLGSCVSVKTYREWVLLFPKETVAPKQARKDADGLRFSRFMDIPTDHAQRWSACPPAHIKGRHLPFTRWA